MTLDEIKDFLGQDWKDTDALIRSSLESDISLLNATNSDTLGKYSVEGSAASREQNTPSRIDTVRIDRYQFRGDGAHSPSVQLGRDFPGTRR